MITFKSDAAGNVIMFEDVAQQLLEIMGKRPEKQGIITVEQLPDTIARLKRTAADAKAQPKKTDEDDETKLDQAPAGGERRFVTLAHRAVPLIELLERSLKAKKPVVWGV